MSAPAHVAFDLDGTLVDSVPVCIEIIQAMRLDRGAAPLADLGLVRSWASVGGQGMVSALLGEACGDPEQALIEFRRRYADLPTPADSLYAGVAEGLARLAARGLLLSVVSNKPQNLCEKVLDELSIAPLFRVVVGARPDLPRKPDPAGLLIALARTGASAASSCLVGDSDLDHAAAQAAGVGFVLAGYGYGPRPAGLAGGGDFADVERLVLQTLGARDAGGSGLRERAA